MKRQAVRRLVNAIRELQSDDPYTLAAAIDFLRQEWKGKELPSTAIATAWIARRAQQLKTDALEYAKAGTLEAAVCS